MNEQALKDRLKHIARNQKKSFQEVWKSLLLERFLVRLAHSKYQNKCIFKGGLLLSYYLVIARETTDIDFLAQQLQAKKPQLEKMLFEICDVDANDDFTMSLQSIEELEHSHMNYPGYRAKLNVRFGNMRDCIQVDIGVGDVVEPKKISWALYQYKGKPFFEGLVSLQAYPVETIFSEKLETIVSRGAANSRMKDFHDIFLLCKKDDLIDVGKLKKSIHATFQNRNTKMTIPLIFTEDECTRLQALWAAHLRTLSGVAISTLDLPNKITELVNEINTWLVRL